MIFGEVIGVILHDLVDVTEVSKGEGLRRSRRERDERTGYEAEHADHLQLG